jgi:hypothetical protein
MLFLGAFELDFGFKNGAHLSMPASTILGSPKMRYVKLKCRNRSARNIKLVLHVEGGLKFLRLFPGLFLSVASSP